MLPYSLIFIMTVMGSVASLFLKKASASLEGDGMVAVFIRLFVTPSLYVGGILYVLSALINIYVLRLLDYSQVLPLTAFTYVWTMILARIKLKEKLGIKKVAGVILIIVGAVLVSMKI